MLNPQKFSKKSFVGHGLPKKIKGNKKSIDQNLGLLLEAVIFGVFCPFGSPKPAKQDPVEKKVFIPFRRCRHPVQLLFGTFLLSLGLQTDNEDNLVFWRSKNNKQQQQTNERSPCIAMTCNDYKLQSGKAANPLSLRLVGFLAFNPASTFSVTSGQDLVMAHASATTLLASAGAGIGGNLDFRFEVIEKQHGFYTRPKKAANVLNLYVVFFWLCCEIFIVPAPWQKGFSVHPFFFLPRHGIFHGSYSFYSRSSPGADQRSDRRLGRQLRLLRGHPITHCSVDWSRCSSANAFVWRALGIFPSGWCCWCCVLVWRPVHWLATTGIVGVLNSVCGYSYRWSKNV